jgi:hypothetical protein
MKLSDALFSGIFKNFLENSGPFENGLNFLEHFLKTFRTLYKVSKLPRTFKKFMDPSETFFSKIFLNYPDIF